MAKNDGKMTTKMKMEKIAPYFAVNYTHKLKVIFAVNFNLVIVFIVVKLA